MVVIDSDVFMIHYRYLRDARFDANAAFLQAVSLASPAITIFTLMEVLGQLSFNLSADMLSRWPAWLKNAYSLNILWPQSGEMYADDFFRHQMYDLPFARMQAYRIPFMDALMLQVAENIPHVRAVVTWNARHFKGKTSLAVMTPAEYLANSTDSEV